MWPAIISGIIAPILALVIDRYRYGAQLKQGAKAALEIDDMVKAATGKQVLPDAARKAAEQAIIIANQREVARLVEHLTGAQSAASAAEQRALRDGISGDVVPGKPELELVERDGTEEFKPAFPPKAD